MLPRPKKNFQLFKIDESTGFFPKQMFEGKMGDLPIFMSVNVGYDPEDPDPFMYPYESQEVGAPVSIYYPLEKCLIVVIIINPFPSLRMLHIVADLTELTYANNTTTGDLKF